jgi:hypothetical protein
MAESLDLFNEVRQLRSRVDELGLMTETLVRAQSKELMNALLEKFKGDPALQAVFLAVDGVRSQNEILICLEKAKLKGASKATVSRKIDSLEHELHLIELADRTAKGKIYKKTNIDRILGVSRKLGK